VELHLKHTGGKTSLRVSGSGHDLLLDREGAGRLEAQIIAANADTLWFDLEGRRHRARFFRDGNVVFVHLAGQTLRVELEDADDQAVDAVGGAGPVLRAPMPGRILEVLVAEGQQVEEGTPVIRLEAMKMEIDLNAPCAGTVASVPFAAGDLVEPDAELVRIDPADGS
jgi:biotin carboxyl carrier protein